MKKIASLSAIAAFTASMTVFPSTSLAQDMVLLCPDGSPAELICTFTRDANGNIVVKECHWNC